MLLFKTGISKKRLSGSERTPSFSVSDYGHVHTYGLLCVGNARTFSLTVKNQEPHKCRDEQRDTSKEATTTTTQGAIQDSTSLAFHVANLPITDSIRLALNASLAEHRRR